MDLDALIGEAPEGPPWIGELLACTACTARDEARRVVPAAGPQSASLLFVGQNPGDDEDRAGVPFCGESGAMLDSWLQVLRLDRDKVAVTNAVKCHTVKNRPPRSLELATCKASWLGRELAWFSSVRVLFTLGRPALSAIIGNVKDLPPVMTPWHVTVVLEADGRELLVVPLPHPAYLLRVPGEVPHMEQVFLPAVAGFLAKFSPLAFSASMVDGARHG